MKVLRKFGYYNRYSTDKSDHLIYIMARANRHHLPGYVWHITHQCHKKEFLLKFDKDKKRWIGWLFDAKKRFGLCVLIIRVPQIISICWCMTTNRMLFQNRSNRLPEERQGSIISEKTGRAHSGKTDIMQRRFIQTTTSSNAWYISI
jgi:hypothetical protein